MSKLRPAETRTLSELPAIKGGRGLALYSLACRMLHRLEQGNCIEPESELAEMLKVIIGKDDSGWN